MNPTERLPLSADTEKQDEIIELFILGLPVRTAARACRLHPNTLKRFIRDNPDFQARLNRARSDRRDSIRAILKSAKTDWRAVTWLFEHPRQHHKWLRELSRHPPHRQDPS